jgi:uncharacterized protein (UPF0335 family)
MTLHNNNGNVVQIDHAALKKIAARISTSKGGLDEKRMAHAALYADAEAQGFHRQALKMALKLKDMDPARRSDYWTSLQSYCDVLGVWDQPDMLGGTPGSEAANKAADEPKPGDAAVA